MLGLGSDHVPRNMRFGGLFITWANIITNIDKSIVSSVYVSIGCIIFLVITKEIQSKCQKRLKNIPIPGIGYIIGCITHTWFVP